MKIGFTAKNNPTVRFFVQKLAKWLVNSKFLGTMEHSHITYSSVITVKFSVLLLLFILWVLNYDNRWHSQRSRKFILVTEETRLFHVRI